MFCNTTTTTVTTGLYENNKEEIFTVFPNPSSDLFYLTTHTPFEKITVTDVVGSTVLEIPSEAFKNEPIEIRLNNRGIYFIKIETLTNSQIKKIIKH